MAIHEEFNWTSFLAPFSLQLWISIIFWIIAASLIIHIINIRNNSFQNTFFSVVQAFCNQGGTIKNSKTSYYIAYFMPYILAVIIIQTYSCIILSFLTVGISPPSFKNLKDVILDGGYKILVENFSYPMFYFQVSKKIFQNIIC